MTFNMMKWIFVCFLFSDLDLLSGFAPQRLHSNNVHGRKCMKIYAGGNFDMTKKSFDVLSLKSRRGDALLQYSSTNQSEPLRINLYGIFALSFAGFPSISEAVLGDQIGLFPTILSFASGFISIGFFVRECSRRSRQIDRIEKEYDADVLPVRVPNGIGGYLPTLSLKDIQGQRRVLAISGNASQLKEALTMAHVLRRRLTQSSVALVAVPTDNSTRKDWGLDSDRALTWLSEAADISQWIEYFEELASDRSDDNNLVAWFGLKFSGRSFGSGLGSVPRMLELFGSFMQPRQVLSAESFNSQRDAAFSEEEKELLTAQQSFYDVLTKGNVDKMINLCLNDPSDDVTKVVEDGGRLDNWQKCLEDGSRPDGMSVFDCDATIISSQEAYTTCLEFPPTNGLDEMALLAVQKWQKDESEWKLTLHQTIPWNMDIKAGGLLQCDCRGCVSLIRQTKNKKTFGWALVDT